MALLQLSPPALSPVSLDEVKRHLRVETEDDDNYLEDLINSSLAHLESISGLKLITQTWRQYFDCVPSSGEFRLEISPVQAVIEIRIFSEAGNATTVPQQAIQLDAVSSPARLSVPTMPPPAHLYNSIEIDLVAGFGDTPVDIPDSLRRALLLLIAHAYEFRGAVPLNQQPASEPHGFQTLIAPFRRLKI